MSWLHVFRRFSIALAAGLAACAHEPAFRAELPDRIELGGQQIAIIGDLQQTSLMARVVRRREDNSVPQQQLIADLQQHADRLGALVIVGDLVFSARSRRDWAHFDSLVAPIADRVPVLPAIGNHDYPCFFIELCKTSVIARGMQNRFGWFEPGQPYAVETERLLLLFLDSETGLERQELWLEQQLQRAANEFAAALVFFHHPAYTNSIDRGAVGKVEVLDRVVPHLREAAVPVVAFSGHIHGLEYIVRDGIHYFTTAGGGGPRGPMAEERPFDRYRGDDCPQDDGEGVFRPFNYLLLDERADRLTISIRGFCRNDSMVRELDSVEIPL